MNLKFTFSAFIALLALLPVSLCADMNISTIFSIDPLKSTDSLIKPHNIPSNVFTAPSKAFCSKISASEISESFFTYENSISFPDFEKQYNDMKLRLSEELAACYLEYEEKVCDEIYENILTSYPEVSLPYLFTIFNDTVTLASLINNISIDVLYNFCETGKYSINSALLQKYSSLLDLFIHTFDYVPFLSRLGADYLKTFIPEMSESKKVPNFSKSNTYTYLNNYLTILDNLSAVKVNLPFLNYASFYSSYALISDMNNIVAYALLRTDKLELTNFSDYSGFIAVKNLTAGSDVPSYSYAKDYEYTYPDIDYRNFSSNVTDQAHTIATDVHDFERSYQIFLIFVFLIFVAIILFVMIYFCCKKKHRDVVIPVEEDDVVTLGNEELLGNDEISKENN